MIIKTLAVAALALSALGGALHSATDPADDPAADPAAGATWQVRPADLDGQSRGAFEVSLDPGARSADAVVITNLGTDPLTLTLSSADIVTTPSGDVTLAADDADPVARGWVTVGADEITLDPGQAAEVPFDIAPPADAEPGDYAVAILSSVVRPLTDDEGQRAVLDTRVGARLYLRVIGDLRSELMVSDLSVARDAGWWNPLPAPASTDFVVTNRGNVRLDATAVVTLTGPFGWELGRTEVRELPQLLPGDSVRLSETAAEGAPSGAAVVAGVVAPFLLTATVEIDATEVSTGQSFAYAASASTVDVPWLAAALVVLLVAAIAARIATRRRRRRAERSVPDGHAVPTAPTATDPGSKA